METLKLLGTALGLASLAGINLYLTVFVTGFAIHFQWITLSGAYQQLEILGHPAVLIVSGTLYLVEFFADKIPWVDSIWDSVHTFIRPIGATMLAIMVLGEAHPVFDVIVGILAAGMSLTAHSAKAGTRLIANSSPEPFSNVALSVVEDVGVLGGLGLLAWNSAVALLVFLVLFVIVLWFFPKLVRATRVHLWLVWRKLQLPALLGTEATLSTRLPSDCDILLHRVHPEPFTIAFATRVISGGGPGIPSNIDGWLVGTREDAGRIYFLAKRSLGSITQVIDLQQAKVSHEPRFLCESVVIYNPRSGRKHRFLLDRRCGAVAEALRVAIEGQIQTAIGPEVPA